MWEIHARNLENEPNNRNNKILERQKAVPASQTEMIQLKAENDNLELAFNKTKIDFLELTKNLAIRHNEQNQTKIQERISVRDR